MVPVFALKTYRTLWKTERQIGIDAVIIGTESDALEILLGRIVSIRSKVSQRERRFYEPKTKTSVNRTSANANKKQLAAADFCDQRPFEKGIGPPVKKTVGVRQQSRAWNNKHIGTPEAGNGLNPPARLARYSNKKPAHYFKEW